MDFTKIIEAIQDAWSFVWPPLITCLAIALIAYYFDKVRMSALTERTYSLLRLYGKKIDSTKSILEPYGLTKLIPIISLIVIITILYVINGFISTLSDIIPPYFSTRPDVLIERSVEENDKLLLLRKYPTSRNFSEAYYFAVNDLKNVSPSSTFLSSKHSLHIRINSITKFLLVFTLFTAIVAVKRQRRFFTPFRKFIACSFLLCALFAISLFNMFREEEQYIWNNQWYPIRLSLQKDAANILLQPPSLIEEKKMKNSYGRTLKEKWWRLSMYDEDLDTWLLVNGFLGD